MNRSKNYSGNGFLQNVVYQMTEPKNRILVLFTLEGMLITLVNNLIGNNNNLFATRLGASEFQLSLLTTIPQLVGLMVLIPGGILTDRMKNKRNMVMFSLALVAVFYALIGFVPVFAEKPYTFFLILLAASVGPMTIYNVSWQAYFSDMVNAEEQNNIYTWRTALTFVIGIIIPFVSGSLLALAVTNDSKIRIHQIYFWIGAVLLFVQIFVLNQIKGTPNVSAVKKNNVKLKEVLSELVHNKKFLGFVAVAIFFYMTWHIDWTVYFIGQVTYLELNEAWISYVNIGSTIIQFLTIGFWSRINKKYGVRFGIIFGSVGLSLCPLCMIIASSLPPSQGKLTFLILNTLSNVAFAAVTLNMLQCLLQVIPSDNKTLTISLYTILVTLSNAFMPMVGVIIYTKLGADLKGFQIFYAIVFGLRIVAACFWFLRWRMLKGQE